MRKIAQTIAVLCLIAIIVLGWMIYAYSIYIAAESAGWIGALLTITLPVVAQIYWIAVTYLMTGVLLNSLLIACLFWVGLFLLGVTFAALADDATD
jgi:hypothetical protein